MNEYPSTSLDAAAGLAIASASQIESDWLIIIKNMAPHLRGILNHVIIL